jgi:hypothetical protein
MDPLFELAGVLLVQYDNQWVDKSGHPPRAADERRQALAPELKPGETLDRAIEICRHAIDEVKRLETQQKPPAAREGAAPPTATPLEPAFDSLRTRRELLTESLYLNPTFALAAVRAVGQYPSYVVDVAQDLAAEIGRSESRLARAVENSNARLGTDVIGLFAPPDSVADRMLVDRAFAMEATGMLELPQPFAFVLQSELDEIDRSRAWRLAPPVHQPAAPTAPAPSPPAPMYRQHAVRAAFEMNLFGLALSGGGIRSATFGLGVLQALSHMDLLRRVDYLSTVSGGGYIGSWLLAWIKRLRGGVHEVQQRLCPTRGPHPNAGEARPLRMLREFSNYLTPQTGFLSGDTWTMVVIWFRNTLLNLLVILALLIALLLIPRWVVPFTFAFTEGEQLRVFVLATLVAVGFVAWNIAGVDDAKQVRTHAAGPQPLPRGHASGTVTASVVVPIMLGSVAAAGWIYKVGGLAQGSSQVDLPPPLAWLRTMVSLDWIPVVRNLTDRLAAVAALPAAPTLPLPAAPPSEWLSPSEQSAFVVGAVVMFVGLVIIQFGGRYGRCILRTRGRAGSVVATTVVHLACALAAAIAATVGGLLTAMLLRLAHAFPAETAYWYAVAFLPPLLVETLAVTVVVHIGLLGRSFPDERREWWSRLGASQLLISVIWTIAFICVLFTPMLLHRAITWVPMAITWVVATWGGVILAKASETSGKPATESPRWREYVALVAPYVFIAGMLIAVSALVHWIIFSIDCPVELCSEPRRWLMPDSFVHTAAATPFWLFIVAAGLCAGLSWRVDVNEFSMHHFYKNRLVRCYLGASRDQEERRPNRFTGFDPDDDVKLSALRVHPATPQAQAGRATVGVDLPFVGPYPIVNVALNLTKGRELAWQERKAESFVFTPQFSGYELTEDRPLSGKNLGRAGYRPTGAFAYPDGPAIGTVAAISGAAANPNMGYHSSPATAFLLTVFNARLGWWLGNPRYRSRLLEPWRTSSPRLGLMYLLSELTGGADNRTKYVNVSDGGHFENLGIYELVRRRCRYILAVDAEQDGRMTFEGLANAVRKCRTDFGVSIDLDLRDVHRQGDRSRAHCTAGRIYYPEPGAAPGHILYIKGSLTGDEPTDVLEYGARNPAFPHQSTGDQWFDESQFESYRMLGFHVTQEGLALAAQAEADLNGGTISPDRLFSRLRDLWTPAAGVMPEHTSRHADLYAALYATAYEHVQSGTVDPMLFTVPPPITSRDNLYVAQAMIDLMHRVFVDLQLDRFANRPHNAGWMRIFQAWLADQHVQQTWMRVKDSYSQRFQSFLQRLPRWRPNGEFN